MFLSSYVIYYAQESEILDFRGKATGKRLNHRDQPSNVENCFFMSNLGLQKVLAATVIALVALSFSTKLDKTPNSSYILCFPMLGR